VALAAEVGTPLGLSMGGRPFACSFADEAQAGAVVYPLDGAKLDTWVFRGTAAAVVHLVCSVGPEGGIAHVYVTVGKPPAPGPKPPNPGPNPVPPRPNPVPPPDSPMTARLRAAYVADTADPAKKAQDLGDLVELYRQAATLTRDKAKVASVADIKARVREAAKNLEIGLAGTRAAISTEVANGLPADGPLTDEVRAKVADLFDAISAALAQIK
jgi:hypothetical protein